MLSNPQGLRRAYPKILEITPRRPEVAPPGRSALIKILNLPFTVRAWTPPEWLAMDPEDRPEGAVEVAGRYVVVAVAPVGKGGAR